MIITDNKISSKTKSNSVYIIGDIHMGVHGASLEWNENIENYFRHFFIPLVSKDEIKPCVIFAGDFFENRTVIDIDAMNRAISIMNDLAKVSEIYMIIGNHDMYKKKNTDINSLVMFNNIPGVNIISDYTILKAGNAGKYLLISWKDNHNDENDIIQNNIGKCNAVIMHTELKGMKYDNGHKIVSGVNPELVTVPILSGHIHHRQEYNDKIYIGCPYQMKKDDAGNIKGVYKLSVSEDDKLNISFIENTYSPKLLYIQYEDIYNYGEKELKNNYIYIIISKQDYKKLDKNTFLDDLGTYFPKGIEFIEKRDNSLKIDKNDIIESNAVDNVFVSSVKKMGLPENTVNKLIEMNIKYLKDADFEISEKR